jgi:DNA-binding transcriptional ArsR family regulator
LRSLAARERTIGGLAEPFNNSLAAASNHVKALEHAALVRRTVQGRKHFCRLDPQPLVGAHQWLGFYERFWSGRLDAPETMVRHPNKE